MMAPKGVVTGATWQRISRSLDKVDNVCKNVSARLGTAEEESFAHYTCQERRPLNGEQCCDIPNF